jgi:hypothetical protein
MERPGQAPSPDVDPDVRRRRPGGHASRRSSSSIPQESRTRRAARYGLDMPQCRWGGLTIGSQVDAQRAHSYASEPATRCDAQVPQTGVGDRPTRLARERRSTGALVPTTPVSVHSNLGLGTGDAPADKFHGEPARQRPPLEIELDEDLVEQHGGPLPLAAGRRASPAPGTAWPRPTAPGAGSRAAGRPVRRTPSPLRRRRGAVGSAGRPRERPVRDRVQGPGRGANGEAVPGRGRD